MRSHSFVILTGVATAATVFAPATAVADALQDTLVQAPSIPNPERGSLAGSLARFAIGAGGRLHGSVTLGLPITLPGERGPLLAPIVPSYAPENGISEWGMGWKSGLAIHRDRILGDLDYTTDDFVSPWGRLVAGSDGAYYPLGLATVVRLQHDASGWHAATADGTKYTFAEVVTVSGGDYEWLLTDVANVLGDHTVLSYTRNASGRRFLQSVDWGARASVRQFRADFSYESLATPFADYRSGDALLLDQRVTSVSVSARLAGTGALAERWRHDLTYQGSPLGPAFYLTGITKVFASGESLPAQTYAYDTGADRLATATLEPVPGLDPVLTALGANSIFPDRAASVDVEEDGLLDLENGARDTLIHQSMTGFTLEPLPAATGAESTLCRPAPALTNPPRTLARMSADASAPNVLYSRYDFSVGSTVLVVCDRAGMMLDQQRVAGAWALGPNIRLADLNRDRRPDLIRVFNGGYQVLENLSVGSTYAYRAHPARPLSPVFSPDASWIQDMNGDGLPDLVERYSAGVIVWYGRGNFQFSPTGQAMPLRTTSGFAVSTPGWQFTFADVNRDGLTDLILTKDRVVGVFLNHGKVLVQSAVPGVAAIPWDFSIPLVADLAASGGTDLTFVGNGHAYALELAGAETGLLRSVDDGMGSTLELSWSPGPPAVGISRRPAVLASYTLSTSGTDPVTFSYDYLSPTLHSAGRFLVGFDSVEQTGPLGSETVAFHNDDDVAGIELSLETLDAHSPLRKILRNTFADHDVFGVRTLRATTATQGWRDPNGVEVTDLTEYLEYERDFCATRIRRTSASGILTQVTVLAAPAGLDATLHCLPAGLELIGQHADPTLDFDSPGNVTRNDLGQPTQVTIGSLIEQDIGYDAQHRIVSLGAPGRGTRIYDWDPDTNLLVSISEPDGVTTRVDAADPLTDALLAITSDHGGGPGMQQASYGYDGLERLERHWDDQGESSQDEPLEQVRYQYATAERLAVLHTLDRVSAIGAERESARYQTGGGDVLATALRTPDGWAVGHVRKTFRQTGEVHTAYRGPLGAVDPNSVTLADLAAGALALDLTRADGFGSQIHQSHTVQTGVTQTVDSANDIVAGEVVHTTTENGAFVRRQGSDAAGVVRWVEDELGARTTFTHDALGRLVDVAFVDGTHQSTRYDARGKPTHVARDGIIDLAYSYDPTTGLPAKTEVWSAAGRLDRETTWEHDTLGRALTETLTLAATGESHVFSFDYDGVVPGKPDVEGQLGYLTHVAGDGFEKTSVRDAKGRTTREVLVLDDWRTVSESTSYYADGSTLAKALDVADPDGNRLFSIQQEWVLDATGRVSGLKIGGAVWLTLSYDEEGKLTRGDFADGATVVFHHDPSTRAASGFWHDAGAWNVGMDWTLSARGDIAKETYAFGSDTFDRTYGYDARRFLTTADDPTTSATYSYGPTGLPSSINDVRGMRSLARTGASVNAGGVDYTYDDLGRVVQRDDLSLVYGPSGDVESARTAQHEFTFFYDETGNRLLKLQDGSPVAGYVDGGYLTSEHFVLPIVVAGHVVGVVEDGVPRTIVTDPRGTLLSEDGSPSVPTPYGLRTEHSPLASALDYVQKGWDADLQVVRMGSRDYDPLLAEFRTPDPLVLQQIDKNLESVLQGNLYSYAGNNPLRYLDPSGLWWGGDALDWIYGEAIRLDNKYHIEARSVGVGHVSEGILTAVAGCATGAACLPALTLGGVRGGQGWSEIWAGRKQPTAVEYFGGRTAGNFFETAYTAFNAAQLAHTLVTAYQLYGLPSLGKSPPSNAHTLVPEPGPTPAKPVDAEGGSGGSGTGGGRGGNQFRGPSPDADGYPHTRFRTDEKGVTTYETYDYPQPGLGKRVDVVGPPHGGVPTPHTVDTVRHVNPNDPSKFRYQESRPRPSTPDEIPLRRP